MIGEAEQARKICFLIATYRGILSGNGSGQRAHPVNRSKLSSFVEEKNKKGLKEYIAGIFNELRLVKRFKNAV